jgi:hypothetical protein
MPDRAKVDTRRAGVGRDSTRTECHQQRPVGRKLSDGVVEIIGAIDGIVWPDCDAVWPSKHAFAPRRNERAVAVEHDQRVLAAVEDEYAITRVRRNGGNFGPTPTGRRLRPAIYCLVTKRARGNY